MFRAHLTRARILLSLDGVFCRCWLGQVGGGILCVLCHVLSVTRREVSSLCTTVGLSMSPFSPIIFASFIFESLVSFTQIWFPFSVYLLFDDISSGITVYLLFTLTFHHCKCVWKPYHHIDPFVLPSLY